MIKKLFNNEVFLYLFFGGLTTVVSTVTHFGFSWVLGLPAWLSSVIAWVFAVVFAFFTNKIFVFKSKTNTKKQAAREATLFLAARLITMAINTGIMLVFVDIMELNEPVFFVIGQAVIVILNYIFSKLIIFKKRD